MVDEAGNRELTSAGVRDSKLLKPARREILAEKIKTIAKNYTYVELPPAEIDKVVIEGKKLHRLNLLEAKSMAEVISRLKPEVAYVDASDVVAERFGAQIAEHLPFKIKIVSEHKADKNYPVVSAASILAKSRREEVVRQLREQYGDFGSGYPTDQRTIRFLESWIKNNKDWPPIVRKSWKTIREIEKTHLQKQL